MKQRSNLPELMDLGPDYYSAEEYRDCLIQLNRIGRFLGGDKATDQAFRRLKQPPSSILDVGCGGGLGTIKLARLYPDAHVVGIDISHAAISFANEMQEKSKLTNIEFIVPNTKELSFPAGHFDVVTSTLVCHHLSDEELVVFLKKACSIAKQAVILNDLHRHTLALGGFKLLSSLFFNNRLIKHDGLLSIKKAFKHRDWAGYLQKADLNPQEYSIKWHWLFRWIITIDRTQKNHQ